MAATRLHPDGQRSQAPAPRTAGPQPRSTAPNRQAPVPRPASLTPAPRSTVQLSQEARCTPHDAPRTSPRVRALTAGLTSNFGATPFPATAYVPQGNLYADAQRLTRLRERTNTGPLLPRTYEAMRRMTPAQQRMFHATVGHLEQLASRHDAGRGRDYMNNVMRSAAQISGGNGRVFVNLVQFAFSGTNNGGSGGRIGRELMGGGYRPAGAALEQASADLLRGNGGMQQGFSEAMTERQGRSIPNNTMTHHFGEFLAIGAHMGRGPGAVAALAWEPLELLSRARPMHLNMPDTRNGVFAAMLGDNLVNGRITPDQAVALTEYAFRPGTPWVGNNDVQQWIQAMNGAARPR